MNASRDGELDADPEAKRIDELVLAVASGAASPAEHEELELYRQSRPELAARVVAVGRQRALGGAWLARHEADERLQRVERGRSTRRERNAGLALTAAGIALCFVAPIVGTTALVLGGAVLAWSFLRVRLGPFRDDPYKDVKR